MARSELFPKSLFCPSGQQAGHARPAFVSTSNHITIYNTEKCSNLSQKNDSQQTSHLKTGLQAFFWPKGSFWGKNRVEEGGECTTVWGGRVNTAAEGSRREALAQRGTERGTGTEAASQKLVKPDQALEQTKIRTQWRHWRRPLKRNLNNKLLIVPWSYDLQHSTWNQNIMSWNTYMMPTQTEWLQALPRGVTLVKDTATPQLSCTLQNLCQSFVAPRRQGGSFFSGYNQT